MSNNQANRRERFDHPAQSSESLFSGMKSIHQVGCSEKSEYSTIRALMEFAFAGIDRRMIRGGKSALRVGNEPFQRGDAPISVGRVPK
jgi:hypothetical protein